MPRLYGAKTALKIGTIFHCATRQFTKLVEVRNGASLEEIVKHTHANRGS